MGFVLDLIIIAIVLFYILISAKRGFISVAIEIVGLALAIVIASSLSVAVSNSVYDNIIKKSITGSIENSISSSSDKSLSAAVDDIWKALPKMITDSAESLGVKKEVISNELSKTSNIGAGVVAKNISDKIARPIIVNIIRIFTFLILIFVLALIVKFLAKTIGRIFKMPVLGGINKLLGGTLGLFKGLIISVIFCIIISITLKIIPDGFLIFTYENINASSIFKGLFNLNPIK